MSKRQRDASGDDHARFFEQLRISTARLLRLDASALSPSQEVRVSRAAALRLQIDKMQADQIAGREIDVRAFVVASQTLETLLGGDPNQPTDGRFGPDHRAKLKALIEKALAVDAVDESERCAVRDREEAIQAQAAAPAPVAPPPAAEQMSQPSNITFLPTRTADGRPPPHYLQSNKHEPWRDGGTFDVPSWPLPR